MALLPNTKANIIFAGVPFLVGRLAKAPPAKHNGFRPAPIMAMPLGVGERLYTVKYEETLSCDIIGDEISA
ncbi:MAG TPA: hypothetical protein PLS55_07300 [Thermogutta sp.]|nr:hypothetical protein [Thermogutta sp.]